MGGSDVVRGIPDSPRRRRDLRRAEQTIAGYSHVGCFGSIALGFIGALIGIWIARALKLPVVFSVHVGREEFPVLWSILGSALFVAVLSFLTRRSRV